MSDENTLGSYDIYKECTVQVMAEKVAAGAAADAGTRDYSLLKPRSGMLSLIVMHQARKAKTALCLRPRILRWLDSLLPRRYLTDVSVHDLVTSAMGVVVPHC